jgi:dTDP-4-dehydrorhamnose reductase
MKILLFGKNGQLGWELQRTLAPLGAITALDFEDLDLLDADVLRGRLQDLRPEVIVNAAAYTDVDGAERDRDKAFAINATAPRIMAEEAKSTNASLIHYSTDYVFDGTKGAPYVEGDTPHPVNAYGESKLAGEQAVQAAGGSFLIFRTAWLYSLRGDNFVTKVLSWARKHEVLHIVDDQIANPTWARTLAQLTAHVLTHGTDYVAEHRGLYHLAGDGYASRYEWAQEILKLDPKPEEQLTREVRRAVTSDIPTPASRPTFSALNCDRCTQVFGLTAPAWAHELKLALMDSTH